MMHTAKKTALFICALALLGAPGSAFSGEYLAAARKIGDSLVRMARKDGKACRWAQYEGGPPSLKEEERHFPVSFYSGSAGTGYFLLNLHRVTGSRKYLDAAAGAGWRLVADGKPVGKAGLKWEATYERKGRSSPEGAGLGLYTGNAGIGLFLMHMYEETKEKAFKAAAVGAFERILEEATVEKGGIHWTYSSLDIIGGEAGIGLALMEMHRLTGDGRYRAAAKKAATWLLAAADREGGSVRWEKYGYLDPNFSHGTAGIAFFLAGLGQKKFEGPARSASEWVLKQAVPCGDGAHEWRYYSGPPPKGKRNWVMNTWCHGAPGTVHLFLLLHRLGGEAKWLKAAEMGGGGIRHAMGMDAGKLFYYNPTYCCGAAGCIDAFVYLHRASGRKKWLDDAKAVADDMMAEFTGGNVRMHAEYDEADQKEKKHPYYTTGFMKGNAGIGHALLHLGAVIADKEKKLIHFPDQAFAHSK
jgi:lantibiotic modifying enzyme